MVTSGSFGAMTIISISYSNLANGVVYELFPLYHFTCLLVRFLIKILLGLHQVGLGPLKVDKLRGYPTCHKTDFLQAWAQKWIK